MKLPRELAALLCIYVPYFLFLCVVRINQSFSLEKYDEKKKNMQNFFFGGGGDNLMNHQESWYFIE